MFIHISFTIMYLAPENFSTRLYGNLVNLYMKPMFYQDWELFGRMVGRNSFHLRCRCALSEEEWKLFGSSHLRKHQENRFLGSGKDYYLMSYFAKALIAETLENINNNEKAEDSLMLSVMGKILSDQCDGDIELEMFASLSPQINSDRKNKLKYDYFPMYSFGIIERRELDEDN